MAITGIRVNELSSLKLCQFDTLLKNNWISINRSKLGPSNYKAFLTKEGQRILKDRQQDFELMYVLKEPESYIFTSENDHSRVISRETLTKSMNKILKKVASEMDDVPNLSSHSFRIGYITQLWKDTKDIEFVKQAVGHVKIETTSRYVENLSDEERKRRMQEITLTELDDLIEP